MRRFMFHSDLSVSCRIAAEEETPEKEPEEESEEKERAE